MEKIVSLKSYKKSQKLKNFKKKLGENQKMFFLTIAAGALIGLVLWNVFIENPSHLDVQIPQSQNIAYNNNQPAAMTTAQIADQFESYDGKPVLIYIYTTWCSICSQQFPMINEIAQSCCAHKGSKYAHFWIHNGFLTVNGEKMSKSLKNFITVRDLLEQGNSGLVIRYLLLSTQYRKPFDFNQKSLDDARKSVEKFYALFNENDLRSYTLGGYKEGLFLEVLKDLSDDLNTAKVFASLHEKAKEIKASQDQNLKNQFLQTLDFLGLFDANFSAKKDLTDVDENYINQQIELRIEAKKEKNWALSDQIRDDLLKNGIALKDSEEGTSWQKVSKKT